jgi:hypothetical protein
MSIEQGMAFEIISPAVLESSATSSNCSSFSGIALSPTCDNEKRRFAMLLPESRLDFLIFSIRLPAPG